MTTSPTLSPQTIPALPRRWTSRWDDLPRDLQDRYVALVGVAGAQLAVATIDLQSLTSAVGKEREQLIAVADEVLIQSHEVVKSLL